MCELTDVADPHFGGHNSNTVFWDGSSCSLVDTGRHFTKVCCIDCQDRATLTMEPARFFRKVYV